jgi:WhiB family redox-sensing transcriptional regulator
VAPARSSRSSIHDLSLMDIARLNHAPRVICRVGLFKHGMQLERSAGPVIEKWRMKAQCRGLTPEEINDAFYPSDNVGITPEARNLCDACPVGDQCLNYALDSEGNRAAGARFGIWNKTTPAMRARMARNKRSPKPNQLLVKDIVAEGRKARQAKEAARKVNPSAHRPCACTDCDVAENRAPG